MFKSFFSILFFASATLAVSQTQDTTSRPAKQTKIDTVKNKYLPTGLRVGTDLIALIRSRQESFKGWELTFDIDLSRYYFTVEYGYWSTRQSLDNFKLLASTSNPVQRTTGFYQNDGYYLRVGADVNFLLKDPEKNMFFLGLRYGISNFSENVQYTNQPSYPGFPALTQNLSNGNVAGSWIEVTSGLRIKVYKGLWMGYTARLKFAPSFSGASGFQSYDMPGYGIISETPYWGFNYQVFWRFDWKRPKQKSK